MLHDQCGSNCVQRKGSSELDRIELPPALLRPLAIIMEKSRRIDYETKLTPIGGERRGAFETGFVQQVDRRRSAATERDHMLEPFRGPDGFDQCPSDASAGAENDRHAGLGKRSKVDPRDRCALRFDLPSHRRLARWPDRLNLQDSSKQAGDERPDGKKHPVAELQDGDRSRQRCRARRPAPLG
jgi:hypothetical protein